MSYPPSTEEAASLVARAWARVEPWARRQWLGIALATAALILLASALVYVRATGQAVEQPSEAPTEQLVEAPGPAPEAPAPEPGAPAAAAPASGPGETAGVPPAPAPAGAAVPRDAGGAPSPVVKVVFRTVPNRRASVMWGGKRLGYIERNQPLVVERPRDSGPLDVVIRAPGYLPVHARAYTFDDDLVEVRITPVDKKDTLFGFKAPLPPEDAGAPTQ